uniref:Secreted protein n=1 Tax=Arion vulgaris TaxID=1028688 RepID=A0A0B7BH53_9EUPU
MAWSLSPEMVRCLLMVLHKASATILRDIGGKNALTNRTMQSEFEPMTFQKKCKSLPHRPPPIYPTFEQRQENRKQ